MSNETEQEAPSLGEPTDAAVGEETAALLMNGDLPNDADADEAGRDDAERTLETPDNLGGTGGAQGGGAG